MKKRAWLILLLVIISRFSLSQINTYSGDYFITSYSLKEYYAAPQNFSIIQDNRGVMFFGNFYCLMQFDGQSWTRIYLPNNSYVKACTKDNFGMIYLGGMNEIGYLSADKKGKLKYVSLLSKIKPDDRHFGTIQNIYSNQYGVYFLAKDQIFRFYNDTIYKINVNKLSNNGYLIKDLIFISEQDSGLALLTKNKIIRFPKNDILLSAKVFPFSDKEILLYNNEQFYLCSFLSRNGNPINISELSDFKFTTFTKKFNTNVCKYLSDNKLIVGKQINKNEYAFCTTFGGIVIMNKQGELVDIINTSNGLPSNTVYDVFEDKDENLWAAMAVGISMIERKSPLTRFDESNGLYHLAFSAMEYNDKIYIGTFSEVYYMNMYQNNDYVSLNKFRTVKNTKIHSFAFCKITNNNEDLLLASTNQSIYQIKDSVAYPVIDLNRTVYQMYQTDMYNDKIFLAMDDGIGVMKIQKDGLNSKFVLCEKIRGVNDEIRKIICDTNGTLWLTSAYNGIYQIIVKQKDFSDYLVMHYDTTDGLPKLTENWVYCIDGRLKIASQKGFYKTSELTNKTNSDNPQKSLKFIPDTSFGKMFTSDSIEVWQIHLENKNKIWLNTSIGIGYLLKEKKNHFTWHPLNSTAKINNYLFRFYFDSHKRMWIITPEGVFLYEQSKVKNYRTTFTTLFQKINLNTDSTIFQGTFICDTLVDKRIIPIFSCHQDFVETPIFQYKNNTIKFFFTSTFYEGINKTMYSYLLEGLDEQWSKWSLETCKEYTNLREGKYTFKVKAKNIYGIESPVLTYHFKIMPPWYRTTLAYIIFIILFMIISYLIINKLILAKNKVVEKYFNSSLSMEKSKILMENIIHLFEKEKIYLNNITIHDIAKRLNTNEKYISQTININLNKNFYNFVNSYRIEAAKKILMDKKYENYTIEALAKEVGFNSRSSFNVTFKKCTGLTPSEYKKLHS